MGSRLPFSGVQKVLGGPGSNHPWPTGPNHLNHPPPRSGIRSPSSFPGCTLFFSLSQWLNFKLLGTTCLVGKIKFKLFFQGPLAEWVFFGWINHVQVLGWSSRYLPTCVVDFYCKKLFRKYTNGIQWSEWCFFENVFPVTNKIIQKPWIGFVSCRCFCCFLQGKSPFNHHLREYVWNFFPSILSKSKLMWVIIRMMNMFHHVM